MSAPPGCESLGRQCQALDVLLRIGSLEEGADLAGSRGHLAPGPHRTDHLRRGVDRGGRAVRRRRASCTLSSPERLPRDGRARCAAHGFEGRTPRAPAERRAAAAAGPGPVPGRGPDEAGKPALSAAAPVPPGARRHRQPLRGRPLRDLRPQAGCRLLPGPADRDHVHPEAAASWRRSSGTGSRPTCARWAGRATSPSTPR